MKTENLTRRLALAVLLAAGTTCAMAQINVNINIAPPAQQFETVPALAPGYVWAPGYWAWHGDRYIWVRGRTVVQRVGYRWEPDRWEQRERMYYRQPGHWAPEDSYSEKKGKKPKHANNGNGKGGKDKENKHNK